MKMNKYFYHLSLLCFLGSIVLGLLGFSMSVFLPYEEAIFFMGSVVFFAGIFIKNNGNIFFETPRITVLFIILLIMVSMVLVLVSLDINPENTKTIIKNGLEFGLHLAALAIAVFLILSNTEN